MTPSVSINVTNGNLGLTPPSEYGTSLLLVATPVAPANGYGVVRLLRNKNEVKGEFFAAQNAPVRNAINDGFFAEAPEGTKLYVVCFSQATTLQAMANAVNAEIGLNAANGAIRLVAVAKFPADSYVPTITEGMDVDVHNAVGVLQGLANVWMGNKKPFRALLPAYGYTNATDAKDYSAATNNAVGIVVGNIASNPALALMLALGRAAKIQPNQNIGRVKSGSLNIASDATVLVGNLKPELTPTATFQTINTKRYITIEKNQIASGYVFVDDNMLCTEADDYNNLRYGRIIDNAVRISYNTYYEELKDDVNVDANGRLDSVTEKALEAKIQGRIDALMRGQLNTKKDGTSDVVAYINPDVTEYAAWYANNNIANPNLNIIQSETIYVFLFLKPKGCLKYIQVYLGLTATTV